VALDRIRFITHRDQRILLVDCSNFTPEEVAKLADLLPEFVTREPLGSVLLLGDFTGTQFSREAVEHIKIAAVLDRPHLKRSAWVGTENLPKAFYDSIRTFSVRQIPTFATRAEAMDYLVS
jgi:hypothetical protein